MIPQSTTALIIRGRGPSSDQYDLWHGQLFNRHGDDLAVWSMNDLSPTYETLHFDIHSPRHHPCHRRDIPWLIHPEEEPRLPCEHHYPLSHVEEKVGLLCMGSSLSWMLALAASIDPLILALPGCDMSEGEERDGQLADARFWMGYLKARGTRFMLDERSRLLSREIYQ